MEGLFPGHLISPLPAPSSFMTRKAQELEGSGYAPGGLLSNDLEEKQLTLLPPPKDISFLPYLVIIMAANTYRAFDL